MTTNGIAVRERPNYKATIEHLPEGFPIPQRRVVCAACKSGDVIVPGARHYDTVMYNQILLMSDDLKEALRSAEQGFIDQWGDFMGREEALQVATAADQLRGEKNGPSHTLFSEDLY